MTDKDLMDAATIVEGREKIVNNNNGTPWHTPFLASSSEKGE
jgi:aspartate 1-decarboxylase